MVTSPPTGEILNRPPFTPSRMAADAWGVVVRQAQPVYGTIHPHQGRGEQVADDPVVLYGLVASWTGPVEVACLVDLHLLASSSGTGFGRVPVASRNQATYRASCRYRVSDGHTLVCFMEDGGCAKISSGSTSERPEA